MSDMFNIIIQELQQRIGQVTAEYEGQIAIMKAQFIEQLESRDKRIISLESQLNDCFKDNQEQHQCLEPVHNKN